MTMPPRHVTIILSLLSIIETHSYTTQSPRFIISRCSNTINLPLQQQHPSASSQWYQGPTTIALRASQTEQTLVDDDEENDTPPLQEMEKAWRYIKKPFLRIGGKGVGRSHGNNLRQLLDQHSVVKVKVNSQNLGSLEDVFDALRQSAEESGAPPGMELLQIRQSENMILLGKEGMMDSIRRGDFPPSS